MSPFHFPGLVFTTYVVVCSITLAGQIVPDVDVYPLGPHTLDIGVYCLVGVAAIVFARPVGRRLGSSFRSDSAA